MKCCIAYKVTSIITPVFLPLSLLIIVLVTLVITITNENMDYTNVKQSGTYVARLEIDCTSPTIMQEAVTVCILEKWLKKRHVIWLARFTTVTNKYFLPTYASALSTRPFEAIFTFKPFNVRHVIGNATVHAWSAVWWFHGLLLSPGIGTSNWFFFDLTFFRFLELCDVGTSDCWWCSELVPTST